ncbi:hypothetical protein [Bradyrhizobium liaoningense]|uniref:hypothetical protein n=1 Tax=Bradyrhizobium liaoningense TaxID=43992 RepID=UPI001BAB3D4D|nr:hypothetical protein [Bradyrhizobium liaoningense]MBR0821669.1 hypothetical protein [Bradyrhizobium liaoningense]
MAEHRHSILVHVASIAEEIQRTREICEFSCALLRLPCPDTFLGRKTQRHDVEEARPIEIVRESG